MRALCLAVLAVSAPGQVSTVQPKIENAKLDTRAVNGSLEGVFHALVAAAIDPAWIGYSVPQAAGERPTCGTVALEGGREFVVLYRAAAGQVEKIRTYATDCTFDAGDLPLHWLTGVDGLQSAMLLSSFLLPEKNRNASSAFSAIGRHLDGAPALIEIARRPQVPAQVRQEAVRWLGRSKDPRALKFFEEILAAR